MKFVSFLCLSLVAVVAVDAASLSLKDNANVDKAEKKELFKRKLIELMQAAKEKRKESAEHEQAPDKKAVGAPHVARANPLAKQMNERRGLHHQDSTKRSQQHSQLTNERREKTNERRGTMKKRYNTMYPDYYYNGYFYGDYYGDYYGYDFCYKFPNVCSLFYENYEDYTDYYNYWEWPMY